MESDRLHLLAEGLRGIEVFRARPRGRRTPGKRHDPELSGGHQSRGDRKVTMPEASLGPQSVSDPLVQRGTLLRLDRIQDVPDLDVPRNILHAKVGLDIVPAARQRKSPLEGQMGGTRGEEHGEGRAGRIGHRVLRIVPGLSGIRKVPESGGNPVDKALGLAGRDVRSGVRNPKGRHPPRMPEKSRRIRCFMVSVSCCGKIKL